MKKLYLGLTAPRDEENLIHYPIIKIAPASLESEDLSIAFQKLPSCSHLIFTSKTAVALFFKALDHYSMAIPKDKQVIAIGKATKESLKKFGLDTHLMPQLATSEGLIELIASLNLKKASFFWPHSALSRDVISVFFENSKIPLIAPKLYTTKINDILPPLDLNDIEEIIFTSPSTIDSFIKAFGAIPPEKILTSIGPITSDHLKNQLLT